MRYLLRYFPDIYPDELLYSVLSRYSLKTGTKEFKAAIRDIFEIQNVVSSWEFPSHIDRLIGNMDDICLHSSDEIIFNNTMIPLYYPFLDKEKQSYAINKMKGDNGKGVYMKIGAMASNIKALDNLKYCQDCVLEDTKEYGVAYWHRSHNIQGVSICHRHETKLRNTCPYCKVILASKNKNKFYALTNKCENGHSLVRDININIIDDYNKKMDLKLSKSIHYILNNNIKGSTNNTVFQKYLYYLGQRDLLTAKGSIRQMDLIEQFCKYYEHNFLQRIGLSINRKSNYNWLSDMLRRPNRISHPLKHILLIQFLANEVVSFFEIKHKKYHPFGDSPWICLNPVAEHYRMAVVSKCTVTTCSDTKKPVGTFECSCGFIYSRRGPDTCDDDKYKIGRIKSFGSVWEDNLRNIVSGDVKSIRGVAKIMKSDPMTIKRAIMNLGLKVDLVNKGNTKEIADKNAYDDLFTEKNDKSKLYAQNIIEYMNIKPNISRTDIRNEFQKEYTWLYRNKKDILYAILPEKKYLCSVRESKRVDWEARDNEVFSKMNKEITRLLKKEKPERITLSKVGKNLGILSLLEQHLNKMPKSENLLNKYIETLEEFQLRRVNLTINRLILENKELKLWRIYREAGISENVSTLLKQKIVDTIVSKENKTIGL